MADEDGIASLFRKWDTAGMACFVVNCAAWPAAGNGGERPFAC